MNGQIICANFSFFVIVPQFLHNQPEITMVFKCQEDSFLKEFTTTCVSCVSGTLKWCPPDSTVSVEISGYYVICEDTILFPEGGGQPCDYGTMNSEIVRSVERRGSQAEHFVETSDAFAVGGKVHQRLDWNRRLDHMQQHSGQHLITDLFIKEFDYNTTSWWLGSETSYIELDTKHLILRESLDVIENKANEIIQKAKEVKVVLVDEEEFEQEGFRARHKLPDDVKFPVRLIRVEGQQDNLCCGTHVTNLAQLQCVKILYAEKSKGGVNIHFVVGNRVLNMLAKCIEREHKLTLALKGGPMQHLDLIEKLQINFKGTRRSFQKALKDLAIMEAEKLDGIKPQPKYYCLHRKDGLEPDFINTFLRHAPTNILYFLSVSEPANDEQLARGHMVLKGPPEITEIFWPKFLDILNGKGNGKDGNYQGKFGDINKLRKCNDLLEEYFATKIVTKKTT